MAVFPGLQGGPHSHAVGGIAVACLIKLGYKVITGGTDIHLVLVDMRKFESMSISGNKDTGPKDKPSLTTWVLANHNVDKVLEFLHERDKLPPTGSYSSTEPLST